MSMRTWTHPRQLFGWIFAAFLILIALSIAASFVLYALYGAGTMGGFRFFPFGFGWIFILLFFLFFWGARWWGGWGWYGRRSWRPADDAHEILRSRYARGEITREQFEQMMQDLERHA